MGNSKMWQNKKLVFWLSLFLNDAHILTEKKKMTCKLQGPSLSLFLTMLFVEEFRPLELLFLTVWIFLISYSW